MKRLRRMAEALLSTVCVLATLFVVGYVAQEGVWKTLGIIDLPITGNAPESMFEGLIANPIPNGVHSIEGFGYVWQSYSIWIRFRAPAHAVESLVEYGYEPVSWDAIEDAIQLSDWRARESFASDWAPSDILHKECYSGAIKCPWSRNHKGYHVLVFDRDNQIVYFVGRG